jgi:hypothetical protein
VSALVDWLFGCRHKDYTFPRTVPYTEARSTAAAVTGTYVVCLECGKELPYDWEQMSIIPADKPARRAAVRSLTPVDASPEEFTCDLCHRTTMRLYVCDDCCDSGYLCDGCMGKHQADDAANGIKARVGKNPHLKTNSTL